MATYSALKERIAQEMERNDIASGGESESMLDLHIGRACEFYADRKFWFNSIVTSASTIPSAQDVTIPAGVRIIERLTIPSYSMELKEVQIRQMVDFPTYAVPGFYAYLNNTIRLYPIPDAVYTLNIYGIAQIDAPTLPDDSNVWTNEAQDLIVGRVKKNLFRGVFRDPDGAGLAASEEAEEFNRMLQETSRRLETPARARAPGGRYNILTDQ